MVRCNTAKEGGLTSLEDQVKRVLGTKGNHLQTLILELRDVVQTIDMANSLSAIPAVSHRDPNDNHAPHKIGDFLRC